MKKKLISSEPIAGFTLIETLIVIAIVGILAAIAGPSWFSFNTQRRINAVNDAVLNAVKQTQSVARRTKQTYSISFRTYDSAPQFAVYRVGDNPIWENLGSNLQLRPGELLLGTNISILPDSVNSAVGTMFYANPTNQTITFDYTGNLYQNESSSLGSKGLIVTVAQLKSNTFDQPLSGTIRCVKITTLLGAMQTEKIDKCNPY